MSETQTMGEPIIEKRGKNYVIKTPTVQTVYVEEELTLVQFVGKKVEAARLEKGWNCSQLAERAGVSDSHIGTIEKGTTNPGLSSLASIAEVLGCHITDLFPPKE